MKLCQKIITATQTWRCPAGVTTVLVFGQAGGQGGGDSAVENKGGYASYLIPFIIPVIPHTNYTITIGAGGVGSNGSPKVAGEYSAFAFTIVFQPGLPYATFPTGYLNFSPDKTNYISSDDTYFGNIGSFGSLANVSASVPGASSDAGVGGTGGNSGNAPSTSYGAGGGTGNGSNGGNGANGRVIIVWSE